MIWSLVAGWIIGGLIKKYLFVFSFLSGNSMLPTLKNEQVVFVSKIRLNKL